MSQIHSDAPRGRALAAAPAADVALDLRSASIELKRELGPRAPAHVTLKRHAADGLLAACETKPQSPHLPKRKLYSRDALVRHYRLQRGEHGTAPSQSGSAPAALDQEALRLAVAAAMRTAIEPLCARLDQIDRRVGELVGVRQSLQLKYDAVTSLAQDRADRLAAEIQVLKRSQDLEPHIARLRSDVSRLADLIREQRG